MGVRAGEGRKGEGRETECRVSSQRLTDIKTLIITCRIRYQSCIGPRIAVRPVCVYLSVCLYVCV